MARRLLKGIMKIHMILAWLAGFLFSCHLVFYPNVGGISVAEDWDNIVLYFSQGLILQYFLLHFFNEQEQSQENN
ncbi:hypothetical protein [Peribacillus simplex]|uniref:hypothetical protein n=1 Tax=Peribacillus simplex TaxID=1478 RepID=UPI000BA6A82F|nr:hypothetical protein [Peribacillus simplex]PAL05867.1 hypothetical protein B8W99_25590 [Peribacillus simplex]